MSRWLSSCPKVPKSCHLFRRVTVSSYRTRRATPPRDGPKQVKSSKISGTTPTWSKWIEAIAYPRETDSSYGARNPPSRTLTHQPYCPLFQQQLKITYQTHTSISQWNSKILLIQMLTKPTHLKQISQVQPLVLPSLNPN